jgi:hypothetical protein
MSETTPYQGLNLPDLLDRMHDLAMPVSVSWLPQTDGWWILLAWLLGLALLAVHKWVIHRQANRYRREALASLRALCRSAAQDDPQAAARVAELVKRTALSAYPRREVAGLYGRAWAEFLIRTGRGDPVIATSALKLANAAYAGDVALSQVLPCAERWIRRHA